MDGQKQPDKPVVEGTEAPAPEKQPRRSFMDIRRPKPTAETPPAAADDAPKPEDAKPAETKQPQPTPAPASAEAPTDDGTALAEDPAEKLEESKKGKQPKAVKPPKPPKPPRQPGVGLAIFATILIILGLAALATYAYLRTNNIAPF